MGPLQRERPAERLEGVRPDTRPTRIGLQPSSGRKLPHRQARHFAGCGLTPTHSHAAVRALMPMSGRVTGATAKGQDRPGRECARLVPRGRCPPARPRPGQRNLIRPTLGRRVAWDAGVRAVRQFGQRVADAEAIVGTQFGAHGGSHVDPDDHEHLVTVEIRTLVGPMRVRAVCTQRGACGCQHIARAPIHGAQPAAARTATHSHAAVRSRAHVGVGVKPRVAAAGVGVRSRKKPWCAASPGSPD